MSRKRVTVITGASSGIGKSLATTYAKNNHHLLLIARRESLLKELQHQLEKDFGVQVYYLALDLTTNQTIQLIQEYIDQHSIDIEYFFNNAGLGFYQKFHTHTFEQIQQMIQLNISTLTNLSFFCIQHWNKNNQDGHLVNISSVAAYVSIEHYVVYAATKAYVKSFSLALRIESKRKNIKVSCVCPGGTDTDFFQTSGQQISANGKRFMMSSSECAEVIYTGVKNNNSIIIPGLSNKISVFLSKIIPEDIYVTLSSKIFNYFMKNN